MGDRRLAKLVPEIHDGGLATARTHYIAQASAPLIIAETTATEGLVSEIETFAEYCEPDTNLILLGHLNDIDTYRTLSERGVADYLVIPTTAPRLVQAILGLYADPAKAPAGITVACLGAKGGTGSSTLSHNAAFMVSTLFDVDTLVVDLDLPFGCADLTFNIETALGVRNILSDPDRVDEVFLQRFAAKYNDHLFLLAAPAVLDAEIPVVTDKLEAAIEALRQQVRYLFLDLPHQWTEWVRACLHLADEVVVTATPDLSSMRNTRNLVDMLHGFRPLDEPPLVVLNRKGANRKGEIPDKDFAKTVGIEPAIHIAEDPEAFGLASSHGKMLQEVKPRAKSSIAVRTMAERLGRRDVRGRPQGRGGLGSLGRLMAPHAQKG